MAFTNLLNDSIIRIRNSQENKKSKTNLIKSRLSTDILKSRLSMDVLKVIFLE